MKNELILKDFAVTVKPSEIKINNQKELEQAIQEYSNQFKGLIVTVDTLQDAKKARAELNKFKKALNDRRKEVKREYQEPLKKFEDVVGQYVATIDEVALSIDNGVKELEENERHERLNDVQTTIAEMAPNYQVNVEDVQIRTKWLNKSYSHKKFLEDLQQDMQTLKKMEDDKAVIVKYAHDRDMPSAPYMNSLETFGLIDTMKNIDSDYEEEQRHKEAEKQRNEAEVEARKQKLTTVNGNQYDFDTGEKVVELQQVSFTLKGTEEAINQVAMLVQSMTDVEIVNASERQTILEGEK